MDFQADRNSFQNDLTDAVGGYFHEYGEGLRRYAWTLLRDEDEAKDAVQAVFLRIWEKKEALDSSQSVKSYLYTAVYHYCLNVKRHEKVRKKHQASGYEATYTDPDTTSGQEAQQEIQAGLDSLPPRCREVFLKSRVEEKKYSVIAGEMGISVKTVEVQMGKALKLLRNRFFGKRDNTTFHE